MKFFCTMFASLMLVGVLAGCASKPEESPVSASGQKTKSQFPKDDLGREVNLAKPAQRIVCIGPGATETIYALGAGKKLVGRDQISDYPAQTKSVPIVGDYTGPFIEKTIALHPDLVIVQGETYDKVRAEKWQQKIGAPVAILVPTSVEKVARGMEKIGTWLGETKRARSVARDIRMQWTAAFRAHSTAFFEVQRSPLWAAGSGTMLNDLLNRSGFSNVFADVHGYKQVSGETLLARQPDFYLVSLDDFKSLSNTPTKVLRARAKVLRALRATPTVRDLKCVREGRVVVVPADWVLRYGPRLSNGKKALTDQHLELDETRH